MFGFKQELIVQIVETRNQLDFDKGNEPLRYKLKLYILRSFCLTSSLKLFAITSLAYRYDLHRYYRLQNL
jgi:hypothetical protein